MQIYISCKLFRNFESVSSPQRKTWRKSEMFSRNKEIKLFLSLGCLWSKQDKFHLWDAFPMTLLRMWPECHLESRKCSSRGHESPVRVKEVPKRLKINGRDVVSFIDEVDIWYSIGEPFSLASCRVAPNIEEKKRRKFVLLSQQWIFKSSRFYLLTAFDKLIEFHSSF